MTNSYLNLAREQYASNGTVDPDVQVGLGTLYYMMGEYGEARDCWVAALGERPDVSCSGSMYSAPTYLRALVIRLAQTESRCRITSSGTASERRSRTAGTPKKPSTPIDAHWSSARLSPERSSTSAWHV